MCRFAGTFHIPQAVESIARAIGHAREQGHGSLLIDTRGMHGFGSPSASTRTQMVRIWAEAAEGQVTIAVIARRALIDPQKLGVIVAASYGLIGNVFESEAEAMAWLRDQ